MTDTLLTPVAFDASLTRNASVEAHWTRSRFRYVAPATVVKINARSVLVTLDADVYTLALTYAAGHVIRLPRYASNGYSATNGVYPVVLATTLAPEPAALVAPDRRDFLSPAAPCPCGEKQPHTVASHGSPRRAYWLLQAQRGTSGEMVWDMLWDWGQDLCVDPPGAVFGNLNILNQ